MGIKIYKYFRKVAFKRAASGVINFFSSITVDNEVNNVTFIRDTYELPTNMVDGNNLRFPRVNLR